MCYVPTIFFCKNRENESILILNLTFRIKNFIRLDKNVWFITLNIFLRIPIFPINFYFPPYVCCQTMLLCDTYRNPRQWKKKWSQSEQIVDQSYFVSSSACLLGIINHHLPFPNIFCHHKFFSEKYHQLFAFGFMCLCTWTNWTHKIEFFSL